MQNPILDLLFRAVGSGSGYGNHLILVFPSIGAGFVLDKRSCQISISSIFRSKLPKSDSTRVVGCFIQDGNYTEAMVFFHFWNALGLCPFCVGHLVEIRSMLAHWVSCCWFSSVSVN